MQSERIYLVWAHPRHDSLTAHIADAIHQRAMERKIQVTELDLYRRNFNPVMTPEDEPDWKNMDKRYSPEVHQWICPYISRHLLSLNPLQARCRRYSRGER
ncbi:hypothetical protein BANRA_03378 [Escherichia coli]|nr:hypothetical protein BANRA_03378 [Escherichia coli]